MEIHEALAQTINSAALLESIARKQHSVGEFLKPNAALEIEILGGKSMVAQAVISADRQSKQVEAKIDALRTILEMRVGYLAAAALMGNPES